MSTTTAVVRAAIAYVQPGPPSLLGERHAALEETVRRYLEGKQQPSPPSQPSDDAGQPVAGGGGGGSSSGELPTTTTRAFAKGRGVRRLVRAALRDRS